MEKRKTAWISQTSRSTYSSTSSMTEVAEIEVNVGDILNYLSWQIKVLGNSGWRFE